MVQLQMHLSHHATVYTQLCPRLCLSCHLVVTQLLPMYQGDGFRLALNVTFQSRSKLEVEI
jgi:hypothetical protein